MEDELSREEGEQASKALIAWFKSQEIKPAGAIGVMVLTLAKIARNSKNPKEMCNAVSETLAIFTKGDPT